MIALKKREKILAVATAALLAVVVARSLFLAFTAPLRQSRADRTNLAAEVKTKKDRLKKAQEAEATLAELNRRALPSGPERAGSLYHSWLLKLADEARFRDADVGTTVGRSRIGVYQGLRFTLTADATLEQLTEFLFRFYSAGHLHQIRTVNWEAQRSSEYFNVTIIVEALSLPGASDGDGKPRQDELSRGSSERLAFSGAPDRYRTAIVQRNIFAPYRPSPPPRDVPLGPPRPEPEFDPSQYAHLVGVWGDGDRREVWLLPRTTGRKLELHEGDTFEVGKLRGRVLRINRQNVEIEIDGQRWLLRNGDNLHQLVKLPDS